MIPAFLVEMIPFLSDSAIRLMIVLGFHMDKEGKCWPKTQKVMEQANIDEKATMKKAREELASIGLNYETRGRAGTTWSWPIFCRAEHKNIDFRALKQNFFRLQSLQPNDTLFRLQPSPPNAEVMVVGEPGDRLQPLPPLGLQQLPPLGCGHKDYEQTNEQRKEEQKRKENNKKKRKTTTSFSQKQIEEIYSAYPRKKAPRRAFVAIRNALARIAQKIDGDAVEYLHKTTKKYAESTKGKDGQYTPYPATWYNGDCWADEPDEEHRSSGEPPPIVDLPSKAHLRKDIKT